MTEQEFYEHLLTSAGLGMHVGTSIAGHGLLYGSEYRTEHEPFDYSAVHGKRDCRHDNHGNVISPQCREAAIAASKARRQVPTCGHLERVCHARGLCNECYRRKRRRDKGVSPRIKKHAWSCEHTDRPHRAHGKCKACDARDRYKPKPPRVYDQPRDPKTGQHVCRQ